MPAVVFTVASTPGARLHRALVAIANQAGRDIERGARMDPQHSIHLLRVRMKKLRALLLLADPDKENAKLEPVRDKIRTIKQALGAVRDQLVAAELLSVAQRSGVTFCPDVHGLQAVLRQQRGTARELAALLRKVHLPALSWEDLANACASVYSKSRRWYQRCQEHPSASRLHQWRTPVKNCYYQMLFLTASPKRCHALHKMGHLLGKAHDLAMLKEQLETTPEDSRNGDVKDELKGLRAHIFRVAEKVFRNSRKGFARKVLAACER